MHSLLLTLAPLSLTSYFWLPAASVGGGSTVISGKMGKIHSQAHSSLYKIRQELCILDGIVIVLYCLLRGQCPVSSWDEI